MPLPRDSHLEVNDGWMGWKAMHPDEIAGETEKVRECRPGPPVVRGGIEQEGPAARVGSFYQLFLSRMLPSLFR